jgi:hypothetical protein
MKKAYSHRRPDAARLWADIEDHLVPVFALSPVDRAIYCFLVRCTRLAGTKIVWTPSNRLGRNTLISNSAVQVSLHRLARAGAIRILERAHRGKLIQVRLPREIRGCMRRSTEANPEIERIDFFSRPKFRESLYRRERNFCFYCRRRLHSYNRTIDHVVSQALGGDNSYRNLVTACCDCNCAKRGMAAVDFLRHLCRQRIFTSCQLQRRLCALQKLKAGKLKPQI